MNVSVISNGATSDVNGESGASVDVSVNDASSILCICSI